mgnify:CR=1 FL=1
MLLIIEFLNLTILSLIAELNSVNIFIPSGVDYLLEIMLLYMY